MKRTYVKSDELLLKFPEKDSDKCLILSKSIDLDSINLFSELINEGEVVGIEGVFDDKKYIKEIEEEKELQFFIDNIENIKAHNGAAYEKFKKGNSQYENLSKLANKLPKINEEELSIDIKRLRNYFNLDRKNRREQTKFNINKIISQEDYHNALKKYQGIRRKIMAKLDLPSWLTHRGVKRTVSHEKLVDEIFKEIHIIRNNESYNYWCKERNIWILNDDETESMLRQIIANKLKKFEVWSTYISESVFYLIRNLCYETKNRFSEDQTDYIYFSNGVYSISKDQLHNHNPKYNFTKLRNYSIEKSARSIEEEKNNENIKFPSKTLDWLVDLLGDIDTANYVCRVIGYCYFRSYKPFQKIFICYGSGANGKSFLLDFITNMLGESNVSGVSLYELDSSMNKFSRQLLVNKEVNIFADIDDGHIMKTGTLKTLSGGDTIMVEAKYKNGVSYKNFAKLLFSANTLPTFSDTSDGFHRRLVVIPFDKKITEEFKAKHKIEDIYKEIPYFSHYCIRLFKDALDKGDLGESKKIKEATSKCLEQMDNVDRFLGDCCECIVDSKLELLIKNNKKLNEVEHGNQKKYKKQLSRLYTEYGSTTVDVFNLYKKYCLEEGTKPNGKKKFKEKLESNGHTCKRKQFKGINKERFIGVFIDEDKLDRIGYKHLLKNNI